MSSFQIGKSPGASVKRKKPPIPIGIIAYKIKHKEMKAHLSHFKTF